MPSKLKGLRKGSHSFSGEGQSPYLSSPSASVASVPAAAAMCPAQLPSAPQRLHPAPGTLPKTKPKHKQRTCLWEEGNGQPLEPLDTFRPAPLSRTGPSPLGLWCHAWYQGLPCCSPAVWVTVPCPPPQAQCGLSKRRHLCSAIE